MLLIALVLAAGGGLLWNFSGVSANRDVTKTPSQLVATAVPTMTSVASTAGNAQVQPAAAAIPEKSVAVLPFENLSDNKDNVYFSDGLSEEILNSLAH